MNNEITDAELLQLIKNYREAHFAYEMANMRENRDSERWRRRVEDISLEWGELFGYEERREAAEKLYNAMLVATHALVLTKPPADYETLVAEMIAEFGE